MATSPPPSACPDTAPAVLDQARLTTLYRRYEKPLYNVVYRWLWHREEARDVVQEAFVRVWRRRDTVRVDTVVPLLYKTALNLAANRRRSRRLWRWVGLEGMRHPGGTPTPDQALAEAEVDHAARRAIEALPERYRRVVMMCELTDMTYAEVAAVLGIPPGTVASRRHQGLERLRTALARFAPEDRREAVAG